MSAILLNRIFLKSMLKNMRNDVQKIIEDTQRLCRQSWLLRIRALRAVEDSKALSDQIKENIQTYKKQKEKLKASARENLL
jgi:hypothetical protein